MGLKEQPALTVRYIVMSLKALNLTLLLLAKVRDAARASRARAEKDWGILGIVLMIEGIRGCVSAITHHTRFKPVDADALP